MNYFSFLYRQIFVHPPQLPTNLDLNGKIILITGANSGIGLAAAKQCTRLNATRLILVVRTLSKGNEAKADIQHSNPTSKTEIDVWEGDMESFDSVVALGQQVQTLPCLHVAMLNAGNFLFEWTTSASTGNESQLQVNHLSPALLSMFLIPVLKKTSQTTGTPSRLTFTSSEVHMWTPFKERKAERILEYLNQKKHFRDAIDRYSVTKLLNVFWIRQLGQQVNSKDVVINYFNPGSVNTGLHRTGSMIFKLFDRLVGRTVEQGGRLLMDAAIVKGDDTNGQYLSEAKITECSAYVRSKAGEKMQKRLWSETMDVLNKAAPTTKFTELLS